MPTSSSEDGEKQLDDLKPGGVVDQAAIENDNNEEDEDAGQERNSDQEDFEKDAGDDVRSEGDDAEDDGASGGEEVRVDAEGRGASTAFPTTRVKRIAKLDPDINLISREGVFAIVNATQLFLESLAEESMVQFRKGKRKSIRADDILVAVASNSKFKDCLGSTVHSLVMASKNRNRTEADDVPSKANIDEHAEKPKRKARKTTVEKSKSRIPPPGSRSIEKFFHSVS